jgi:HSP20 family molecular chaperone IbpA
LTFHRQTGEKEMKKAFRNLLTSVDLLNTINGGVSEPFISYREDQTGREVRIRVPGVAKESLQVEINNNELTVYHIIPLQSLDKWVPMQQIVFHQTLPYFIEIRGINAVYDDNELVVKLPFNKLARGYSKNIKVGND